MKIFRGCSELRGDEITLKWKENENTLSSSAARMLSKARTGSPNWQLGTFREVIPSVSSCGWDRKTIFHANAPDQITNKTRELRKSFLIHPDATLRPQLCASLHFKLVFVSSLDITLLFLCSLYAISVRRRLLLVRAGEERERTFQKSTDSRWISAIVLLSMEETLQIYCLEINQRQIGIDLEWPNGKQQPANSLAPKKVGEKGKEINLSFTEHAFKSNVFRRSRCVCGRMGFLHFAFLNLALFGSSSSPSNYFVSHNVPTAISDTNKSFQWYYERSGFIPPFPPFFSPFNAFLIPRSSGSRA